MKNYRFVHITIGYAAPGTPPELLEPVINALANDWLRYTTNAWILWTNKHIVTCMEVIRDRLLPQDHLFIHPIDMTEVPGGSLPPWMWDWVNRGRNPISGEVFTTPPPVSPLAKQAIANALIKGHTKLPPSF